MDIKKKLGKKIRDLRVQHSLTQEALAEKINLSAKTLSQIEVGNNFVSTATLEKICSVLNLNPKILFDFDDYSIVSQDPVEEISNRLRRNPALLKIIYKIVLALD